MTQWALLLFAWLLTLEVAGRPDRARVILRGATLAGILCALYGISQYFGWDPLLPASAYRIGEGLWTIVRPPGTLGYVSYFATWLLGVVFLSLALASMETIAAWRRTAWAAASLALAAMLLTGTRAALLGLVAGAAVWLYGTGFRPSRRIAMASGALLLAAVAFYYSPPGWGLRSRTRWFVEDPWGGARLHLWRDSLSMAVHRPLAGFGPEVFTAEFPRFESKDLAHAYPDFAHESPHNMFLDALVAQGIPGLAALCGMCLVGFAAAWRKAPWLAAALAAGIVSQQFTAFTLPTALVFYSTVALAVGLASEARPVTRRAPWLRMAAVLVAVALVYVAARLLLADHALALARRSVQAGDIRRAESEYAQYERRRFPGAAADLWYSRACMTLAQKTADPMVRLEALAQSGAAAVNATRTAEDPFNAWYNLAVVSAARNDAAGAERSLRAAIAAHPNWFKPHWTLAQVLRLEGRLDEAAHEAALASELNGGKNPEVARTLEEVRTAQRLVTQK